MISNWINGRKSCKKKHKHQILRTTVHFLLNIVCDSLHASHNAWCSTPIIIAITREALFFVSSFVSVFLYVLRLHKSPLTFSCCRCIQFHASTFLTIDFVFWLLMRSDFSIFVIRTIRQKKTSTQLHSMLNNFIYLNDVIFGKVSCFTVVTFISEELKDKCFGNLRWNTPYMFIFSITLSFL